MIFLSNEHSADFKLSKSFYSMYTETKIKIHLLLISDRDLRHNFFKNQNSNIVAGTQQQDEMQSLPESVSASATVLT